MTPASYLFFNRGKRGLIWHAIIVSSFWNVEAIKLPRVEWGWTEEIRGMKVLVELPKRIMSLVKGVKNAKEYVNANDA